MHVHSLTAFTAVPDSAGCVTKHKITAFYFIELLDSNYYLIVCVQPFVCSLQIIHSTLFTSRLFFQKRLTRIRLELFSESFSGKEQVFQDWESVVSFGSSTENWSQTKAQLITFSREQKTHDGLLQYSDFYSEINSLDWKKESGDASVELIIDSSADLIVWSSKSKNTEKCPEGWHIYTKLKSKHFDFSITEV